MLQSGSCHECLTAVFWLLIHLPHPLHTQTHVHTVYVVAMAIIQRVLEAIGAAIGQVIVAIVVGIIGGIVTGITGGRVNIPTPRIALQTGRRRRTPSRSPG